MLLVDLKQFEINCQNNINDWCRGGPHKSGYTRLGVPITCPAIKFTTFKKMHLSPEIILQKNYYEVCRWHINFLLNHNSFANTKYYQEYLMPRYGKNNSVNRAERFLQLFDQIRLNGYNYQFPIQVADVSYFNWEFKYFRFDGCHRASIAHVLKLKTIPVYSFTTMLN